MNFEGATTTSCTVHVKADCGLPGFRVLDTTTVTDSTAKISWYEYSAAQVTFDETLATILAPATTTLGVEGVCSDEGIDCSVSPFYIPRTDESNVAVSADSIFTAIDTYATEIATYESECDTVEDENSKIREPNVWEKIFNVQFAEFQEYPEWPGEYAGNDFNNTVGAGGYGETTDGMWPIAGNTYHTYGSLGQSATEYWTGVDIVDGESCAEGGRFVVLTAVTAGGLANGAADLNLEFGAWASNVGNYTWVPPAAPEERVSEGATSLAVAAVATASVLALF